MHQAKTEYYSAKICASATCREFFLNVNTLLGKAKPSTFPTTYTEEELPGVFSDFFQSKIIAIRNNLDRVASSPSSAEPGEFSGCPLVEFRPVSQEFVRDLLKRTPPKSCELDSMPTTLMYECMDVLLPSLTQIINESLTTGVFPPDFKTAIVKPQLKKNNLDPNNVKNYRPISNLAFLSKLLQKTVLCQLQDHLKSNDLYSPFQSAYQTGHSTETALTHVTNDLLAKMDVERSPWLRCLTCLQTPLAMRSS